MAAYNRMYFFVYWVDGPFIRGEGEGGLIHACVCLCGGGGGLIIRSLRYTKSGGANHSSFNKKRGDFEQKIIISSNMEMKKLLPKML